MDLCAKYGGFEAYHKIILELYEDLFDHPEIAHHFIGVDREKLSVLQAQFVARSVGGKIKYEGRPLFPVHISLNISEHQLNLVVERFESIFLKNGFESRDVKVIVKALKRSAPYVVSCKLSLIDRIMIPIYRFWDRFCVILRRH